MQKNIILSFLALFLLSFSNAQEGNQEELEDDNLNTLAFVFGYTHIPGAFEEGRESKSVFVPTIGLDYFRKLNEKWKIGVVFDLELSNYLVDFNREELERENALILGIIVGYEFAERWSLLLGPGMEFEKNENLFILRAGIEYEFELGNNWGIFPSFNYDFKEEYSSWSINIGVSKSF